MLAISIKYLRTFLAFFVCEIIQSSFRQLGVIKIFYDISLVDDISISLISNGLYQKMITSAAGLVVGVFAFVSYHYLNLLIDRSIYKIEEASVEFIDVLQDPNA
jgi:biopolymer transport protein ExbB